MSEGTNPQGETEEGAGGETTTQTPPPDPKEGYYRRQFEKQKAELDNLKRERMSEADRLKAERDEAKAEAEKVKAERKADRIERALEKAALKAGAHDLEAVVKLADHSKIDVSDDGAVHGIDQALKDLQKSRAYLFGPAPRQTTGSGGGRPSGGNNDKTSVNRRMNDYIRAQANK